MFYPLQPFSVTFSRYTSLFIFISFICDFVCGFIHHILLFSTLFSVDFAVFLWYLNLYYNNQLYTYINSTSIICGSIILHLSSVYVLNIYHFNNFTIFSTILIFINTMTSLHTAQDLPLLILYFTYYDTSQSYSIFITQDLSFT